MTDSMVDRVAKAIQEAIYPSEPLEAWELRNAARAAIAAYEALKLDLRPAAAASTPVDKPAGRT